MFFNLLMLHMIMILKINAEHVVSEEDMNRNARKQKNTYSKVERRFMDDIDDTKWHISHLKDTDFNSRRSGCPEETFEEKARRYRKSLLEDGALVEFVSADALPFDLNDIKTDVCKIPEKTDRLKVNTQSPQESGPDLNVSQKVEVTTEIGKEAPAKPGNKDNDEVLRDAGIVATTTAANNNKDVPEPKEKDGRRASEYMFSSIEYYDEGGVFDAEVCPDAVEEVILEQDHIRNYDVHCERVLIWRSLE